MAPRMRDRYALQFTLLAALTFALISCGGTAAPDTSAPSGSAAGEPSMVPDDLLDALEPTGSGAAPSALPDGGRALGGTPYHGAAARLRDTLAANGFDVAVLDVHVLPVAGTGEALLVLQVDESLADGALPDDAGPELEAVLNAEAAIAVNVTRLVVNVRASDAEGPLVITFTASVDTLRAMIAGELSAEQSQDAILIGVTRP